MTARADRPRAINCRRDVSAPPTHGPHHLLRLVRQVAVQDRTAFADLYRLLAPALAAVARSQELDPPDTIAIIAAAFHEVWWMARFHTSADADIRVWTTDIVLRRATEHPPAVPCGETWTTEHDQHLDDALSVLLGSLTGTGNR